MTTSTQIVSTSIRRANLDTDADLLIEALGRWLPLASDLRRFNWLYKENPHGRASVWIATDGEGGPFVGAAAAFPRLMRDGVDVKRACVLGDFFIVPQYRTLGPAVQLQRACLASVDTRSFDFCYDFPAAGMLPVYRRLAIEPAETLVRLAKPLRADRKIHGWVKVPSLANKLAYVANYALRVRDSFAIREGSNFEVSLHSGACAEEFTELAISTAPRYGLCTDRSASYLNWRYKNHYSTLYEFLAAREKNGKLLGYVIYTKDVDDPEVVDLFGGNETVIAALVGSAISRVRSYGATTIGVPVLSADPMVILLEKLGFFRREGCPVVTHTNLPGSNRGQLPQQLFLMQGDRES